MKIELNDYFRRKKPLAFAKGYLYGRGGETRTRDTRFWRPVLYQLNYWPVEQAEIRKLRLVKLIL